MKGGGAKVNVGEPDFRDHIEQAENAVVQAPSMTKPCPLYFKPADILAALSHEIEAPYEPEPIARSPRGRPALWRMGTTLSSTLRRPRWLSSRGRGSGTSATAPVVQSTAHTLFERPLAGSPAMPGAAKRGLLSHFTMVQTGT